MVTEEKTQEINSNNYLFQISILLRNDENKIPIFPDLKTFNGIFIINNSASKESMKEFNLWIEEINNILSKTFLKVYIYCQENNKIIDEDFIKYLQTNKIEFREDLKENLVKNINDLIMNQITNIDKDNMSGDNGSFDSKEQCSTGSKNSKEEKENKILKSLDPNLFFKTKEQLQKCSFLYENNFINKIFYLIEKLKKFENAEIEDIYDLIVFLKSEKSNLEDIMHNLPLTTIKNKNAYFASYYYYILNRLLYVYESNKNNKEKNEYEYYQQLLPEEENEDKKERNISEQNEIKVKKINQEEIDEIKKNLEKKHKIIISELKKIYVIYENILKNNYEIKQNEISLKIDINIGLSNNIIKELNDLKEKILKYENILKNLENFVSNSFKEYLCALSILIISIDNTLNYFKDTIINTEKFSKEDIDDFIDFIYFIFNYDCISNFNKISEMANYFEFYFKHNKYENKVYKIGNFKYEIKDGTLTQTSRIKKMIRLEKIDNYCLDLINKYQLCENYYINQKYLWFLKFRKNNYLEKNKKVFEGFFQNIFKKNSIKQLMKKIFPYLRVNYIVDEKFISDFFEKIRGYNFHPRIHCGETMLATLEIFIKGYFENTIPRSDICAVASYIIIIFHEFAHYMRLYLYHLTRDETYRRSINLGENDEIGDYLETLLFGDKINFINLIQAIYILDENNYNDTYNSFKEGFEKIKNEIKKKTFKINLNNLKTLRKELNLYVSESEIIDPSRDFSVKNGNNYFIIGNYNDKIGRPVDIKNIFKGTAFE